MQTIEIKTAQNVKIAYELASLRERFFALAIDFIIVRVAYFIFLLLFLSATNYQTAESGLLFYVQFFLMPIAVFILYQFFMELFASGQSLGKKMLGLKVVATDGKESNIGDHLVRAIFYLIDLTLSAGIIGALMILSSDKRQRLGDYAANTTVIKLKSSVHFELNDILNIDSIDAYEPLYPQVRQLSEKDMLLIKATITRYQANKNTAHTEAILLLCKRIEHLLDLPTSPSPKIDFLKTLLKDYIVLTR